MRIIPDIHFVACWNRLEQSALLSHAEALQLDVLHIQHEFGLFRDTVGFLQTLRQLKRQNLRIVVTLHTAPSVGHFLGRAGWLDMLFAIVDAVVVHTSEGYTSLVHLGQERKLIRLPHGTPEEPPGDRVRGYELLDLRGPEPASLGLVYGFIGSGKNPAATVLAFGSAKTRGWLPPTAMLAVVGDSGGDTVYVERGLRPAIEMCGYRHTIKLLERFVLPEEVPHLMAAADYGVLNTQSNTYSASGQVHQYIAHGVPLVVANRPIYSDAIHAGAPCFEVNSDAGGGRPDHPTLTMEQTIAAVGRSPTLRKQLRVQMRALAEETAWSRLAPKYAALYERLGRSEGGAVA